jgi:citrate synthase
MNLVKEKIQQKLPGLRERVDQIRRDHGSLKVCDVTVDQLYNGLRGVMIHVNDVSYLDPEKGIRFRGFSLPDLIARLPKFQGSKFPLAGGLFCLLMTGELPGDEEALAVEKEWSINAVVPDHVQSIIKAFPPDSKPMIVFSAAILASQHESTFDSDETKRFLSDKNWEPYLADGFNLIAKLPGIAALIYHHLYKRDGDFPPETRQDWNSSFAHLIGKTNDFAFEDYCGLFFMLHAGDEGDEISANISRLAASAHADIHSCCAAAMAGLSVHSQGNREFLLWLQSVRDHFKGLPKKDSLAKYLSSQIESGTKLPGNGSGSLRIPDPRFTTQLEFAEKHHPDDKLIHLTRMIFDELPSMVLHTGRIKSSYPNIGPIDGLILRSFGLEQAEFHPVLLGMSRILGLTANVVWSRALNLPIEKPKGLTSAILEEMIHVDNIQEREYGP